MIHSKFITNFPSMTSTEEDSSEDKEQEQNHFKTNPTKHKTELCKNFSELGYCNYGNKCRFAHGQQELMNKQKKHCLQKKCNGFWRKGVCSYGIRCKFKHFIIHWSSKAYLEAKRSTIDNCRKNQRSKLLILLSK